MKPLKILHISDAHWSSNRKDDFLIVRDALIRDLQRLKHDEDEDIDICVFSGDLVQSGDDPATFKEAFDNLLLPILNAIGLDSDHLFIAPGNHDISRAIARDGIILETGLSQTLRNVQSCNSFIDSLINGNKTSNSSIERMEGFYKFVDEVTPNSATRYPILRTYKRSINDKTIGIACFDTAWRATGEPNDIDRHKLIVGERIVDHAIRDLADTDVRLAVMHHPSDWLADWDESAVSSRLAANFHTILCGHTHAAAPQTRTTAQGTAVFSQTGSLFAGRGWFNGYQILTYDADTENCEFKIRTWYDTPRREFDKASNICTDGIVSFSLNSKKKRNSQLSAESFLMFTRENIRKNASDHLNMLENTPTSDVDFKEAFIAPPLSTRISEEAESGEDEDATSKDQEISPEEVLRSEESFVISGLRESGKTSLLHYLAILCAESVCDKTRIPVIINAEILKSNRYNLKKAISYYFGPTPSQFDLDKAIDSGEFLFLVDNYAIGSPSNTIVDSHIKDTKGSRWIIITQPRAGSITHGIEQIASLTDFVKVSIQALPRRSIRALSQRWSSAIGSTGHEVFTAVMRQLKAAGLPRTGYMVTLILWAMQQERELDKINESILLSNVADYLLGKADFTLAIHGKLDPRAKEIILEFFAEFLNGKDGNSSCEEAITYLSDLFKAKRLPFSALDVLNEMIRCGIIDKRGDIVRFKYKCFEEYFFALRLKSDSLLFSSILSQKSYLRFSRELVMLAGLRRQNDDMIRFISDEMSQRMPDKLREIDRSRLEAIVQSSLGFNLTAKQISDLRRKRLSSDQVDDLLDTADRRATRSGNGDSGRGVQNVGGSGSKDSFDLTAPIPDTMNVSEYIVSSNLLAHIIKNSDFSDFTVKGPAFSKCIDSMSVIAGLFTGELRNVLDETAENAKGDPLSDDHMFYIVYYMSQILLKVLSSVNNEALSSPSLIPVAEEVFNDQASPITHKLFSAFLLQYLKSGTWHEYWNTLIESSGVSGFTIEMIMRQLRSIIETQFIDESENEKIHYVIDVAEKALGKSAFSKDRVISDLRKAKLQVDRRDTT